MTSRVLALVGGFAIPISTALTVIALSLMVLFWIMAGDYRQKWYLIQSNKIALLTLILYGLFALGIFYSPGSWTEAFEGFLKYRKLLLIAVLTSLFQDDHWRRWAIYAFMTAMLLTLALSYVEALGWWSYKGYTGDAFVFKTHITQNILMAFTAYVLVDAGFKTEGKWLRSLYGILAILAVYNILFMVQGRTGYIVLAALAGLIVYRHVERRVWPAMGLTLLVLGTGAFTLSTNFQSRMHDTWTEIHEYLSKHTPTPAGLRIDYYKNGLILLAENPLFGLGSGSFSQKYNQLPHETAAFATPNLHNEYLMIGVQLGLLGLGLFIYILYSQWRMANRLPERYSSIAWGLIITFAVACLLNSSLLDFTEGHFYAYFSGILYATLGRPNGETAP